MPPPMMTTSYSFIEFEVRELAARMRDYARTHQLCHHVAIRKQRVISVDAGFRVALFFESHDRAVRGNFNFPIHDRALGDRHGARADLAADHRRIADLQLILDGQAPQNSARDDRLMRPNVAVPTAGDRQIQRPFQLAIAVHFAGNHELARAADIADEHRARADESRSSRVTVQKSAFFLAHGHLLSYRDTP